MSDRQEGLVGLLAQKAGMSYLSTPDCCSAFNVEAGCGGSPPDLIQPVVIHAPPTGMLSVPVFCECTAGAWLARCRLSPRPGGNHRDAQVVGQSVIYTPP